MVDDGIKITHREETFNDHAVEELADARAKCICRLRFGRCSLKDCETCSFERRFSNCFSEMNDYDKVRLESRMSEKYGYYSQFPDAFMSHSRNVCVHLVMLAMLVIVIVLMVVLSAEPAAAPYVNKYPGRHVDMSIEYTYKVKTVLKATASSVYDFNRDGEILCGDYAVIFKKIWDKTYPKEKNNCVIVRNYNDRTFFHHMFVSVYDACSYRWVDVETVEDNLRSFDTFQMADVWGDKYDRSCNYHGETAYWLSGAVYPNR